MSLRANDLTYTIVATTDLPNVNFSQIITTSADSARKSLDATQFVITYAISPPFIEDGTVVPISVLHYTQASELLATPEWRVEIEE